ncbi:MAG: YceI family protein [Bacteroidota bacterium]
MKQFSLSFLACLIGLSCLAQETWVVDNPHSNVRFEVGWQEFSMRTGEFKLFDGEIITESLEDLSNSSVEFIVDAASVDVISDRLAGHVKGEKFLNVEEHPEITFTSNQLSPTSDSTYVSTGKLTICGVEKEQEAFIWVKGQKETKKGKIFGIEVTLVVDRQEFGLDWGSPRLADKIKIVGHLLYKIKKEE